MNEITRSAITMANRILNNKELIEKIKTDPEVEIPKLANQIINEQPPPLDSDVWIYRIVVGALGSTVIIVVLGSVALAWHCPPSNTFQTPEVLTAIGSAAVGALAGLLAPSPNGRQ